MRWTATFTSGPTASEATNSVTPTTDACSTRSTSSGTPTVYIDYGRVDLPRELRRVHIRRGMLTADLYIGGRYYDRITLYMQ